MIRAGLLAALVAVVALVGSCSVNEYCLNCATGDGGPKDAPDGDAKDSNIDAPDAGACVPTGAEICDGIDNDCDGHIDNGVLPGVGDACTNQMGECAGGKQQCVAGVLKCDKPPMPEICDMKDNNCNGTVDEGDPGGGAACGTNVGECTAGVLHCNPATGTVDCYGAIGTVNGQPEICNGRDDDCDGSFDEGIGIIASCGGPNVGACHTGNLMCMGGGTICVGDQGPVFEACDNIDNDCDGSTDEDYNKLTDPQNCGSCNHVCTAPHATSGCAAGGCTIASCASGYHDVNGTIADGCEYGPCQANGAEVCDGVDNDCDGQIDNGVIAPPGLCSQVGACSGAVAVCSGAGGWKCTYGATVSTDAMGNIIPETKCDGLDNDCDTKVDENQPNLTQPCHDNALGVCQSTGTFTCDPANLNGPAKCTLTTPGSTASTESCDGKDNDCDGVIDNGAATGNLAGQEWVTLPSPSAVQIMKYEASRPDATAALPGTTAQYTCSHAGVQPWINVTYPQAVAACTSIGARLCTEAEWENMCAQPTAFVQTYPVVAPTTALGQVQIEAEDAQAFATGTTPAVTATFTISASPNGATEAVNTATIRTTAANGLAVGQAVTIAGVGVAGYNGNWVVASIVNTTRFTVTLPTAGLAASGGGTVTTVTAPATTRSWTADNTGVAPVVGSGFSGTGDVRALVDTGANVTAANAVTQSPRMDFTVDFGATAANYFVWVRMMKTGNGDDTCWVGVNPTAPSVPASSLTASANSNRWGWSVSSAFNVSGTQVVSVYMQEDGARIDAISISRDGVNEPVPANPTKTWAYQANSHTAQPQACNDNPYDTDPLTAGDQDDILPTGSLAACFANGAGTNDAYDMSGNVKEWAQARAAGQNPIRGGASNNEVDGLTCELDFTLGDDTFFFPNVGFRCCR